MIKRMVIMLAAVAVVFGLIFGFLSFKRRMIAGAIAAMKNPAQTVSTTTAQAEDWQTRLRAVGSARAVNGADVSAQVAGIVSAIHFKSGTDVKAGDLLLELVSTADFAHLDALKAAAHLAQLNYDRDSKLNSMAVSRQAVDTDLATLQSDQAQVAEQQAQIEYKKVRAPFSGRLGIRQVDLGQYIAAGAPIVTLQQIKPIYVDFHVPQQALASIAVGQEVNVTVDAFPGENFAGRISSISSRIEKATRTVETRAVLANADEKLRSGMFVNVEIVVGSPKRYVTLPETAIAYNSYGDIVYLVERRGDELIAHQTFVKTGPTRGDQVAVIQGVKPGDVVVTAGQFKLRNGSKVKIDNQIQPPSDAHPKLSED
ncbi:efflux RND transporter periplasmic adaptor subunit [Rhodoblastus acidophilus]|uniref:Efflux RND transporter periplasmic adaptor subunit n=1 Tax=Candidatus Rhodoblastus alkanivorans TaxID=2954117 RepID=A0ABS9Z770_9HYPH|nr:efflux RND transporter periplasmic adaptor subunit [Candidatus Rhodoblastus alkanivorans]MCI4678706.1 efflux RND transporter periplasmic adaptor subunit [Candidatus Rhodoblastus alkanivorans]MCI4683498.1 efflux RND transporter periplasmic adaptor subunit [Candidatus Rhodoblastus alkanivorans]MDI4640813.1 efflux RND transporter periplasmic adaptor subunit [Rhodoblastus acidophilus]